jgi:hypothetical protein
MKTANRHEERTTRLHLLPEIVLLEGKDDRNREFALGKRTIFEGGFTRLEGAYYIERDTVALLSDLPSPRKLVCLVHEVGHALIWRIPFHWVRENLEWFWDCLYMRRRIERESYVGYYKLYRHVYGRFPWLFGFNLEYTN